MLDISKRPVKFVYIPACVYLQSSSVWAHFTKIIVIHICILGVNPMPKDFIEVPEIGNGAPIADVVSYDEENMVGIASNLCVKISTKEKKDTLI